MNPKLQSDPTEVHLSHQRPQTTRLAAIDFCRMIPRRRTKIPDPTATVELRRRHGYTISRNVAGVTDLTTTDVSN